MNLFQIISDSDTHELRKYLSSEEASLQQRNEHGYTPLHWAIGLWRHIKNNNPTECIRLLSEAGADWNATMTNDETKPVHLVDSYLLLDVLKNMHVDLLVTDTQGRNLMMKNQVNNPEIFEHMIKLHGDTVLNLCDHAGNTSFHYAVQSEENENTVRFLLEKNSDWDAPNHQGETPLSLALPAIRHIILDKKEEIELDALLDTLLSPDNDEVALSSNRNDTSGMIPAYPGQFDMNLCSHLVSKYPNLLENTKELPCEMTEETEEDSQPSM